MVLNYPHSTNFKLHCKKKPITVRGIKREIEVGKMTLIFYICEHLECKYRSSCVYLFPDTVYHCHECGTYSDKAPLYKLSPIGRLCNECGAFIIDIIPPNWRLDGLKQ